MPWKLTYDGHVHRENDLTIGQAERIETLIGETWLGIAPLRSAKHALAILTVVHADATGKPAGQVRAEASAVKVNDFAAMFSNEADDLPETYQDGIPSVADAR